MTLNKTEKLQLKYHRNDRWQIACEGGFTSTPSIRTNIKRRSGKIFRGSGVLSEQETKRNSELKKVLTP